MTLTRALSNWNSRYSRGFVAPGVESFHQTSSCLQTIDSMAMEHVMQSMFVTENTARLLFSSIEHHRASGLNLKRSRELLKTVTELIAIAPAARKGKTS